MSALNKKPTRASRNIALAKGRQLGVSKNGNVQYKKDSLQRLFEIVVGSLYGKDSFYESGNARVVRAKATLAEVVRDHGLCGIEFAARSIVFARTKMHLRTMPIVMAVELTKIAREHNAKVEAALDAYAAGFKAVNLEGSTADVDLSRLNALQNGQELHETVTATLDELRMSAPFFTDGRKLVASVINRADELTDLYAYALTVFGEKGKVPIGLKNGVADAFKKFDGYQLAKYNREGQVTLKRLLRIVHATPKDEAQSEVFAKLMSETLEPPHTWEVIKSANGQLGAEKLSNDDLWTSLATRRGPGEMGYMALLRNLRNITQAGVSDATLRVVANRIRDPEEVAKSRQLPWAFINAYEMLRVENAPMMLQNAVTEAIEHSLGNLPKLGDKPWVILDCSSSMNNYQDATLRELEAKKPEAIRNSPIRIGAIFAAALAKASKGSSYFRLSMFSDRAEFVDLNLHDSIITMYKQIMKKVYGGGTNIEAAVRQKSSLGFTPDAIVVISDMEVNRVGRGAFGQSLTVPVNLTADLPKNCVKVALNLNASVTTPLDPRDGWLQLAGWSEGIFRYVDFTRNAESVVDKLFNGELGEYR